MFSYLIRALTNCKEKNQNLSFISQSQIQTSRQLCKTYIFSDKETEDDEAKNAETDETIATEEKELEADLAALKVQRKKFENDQTENEEKLKEIKLMHKKIKDLKLSTR